MTSPPRRGIVRRPWVVIVDLDRLKTLIAFAEQGSLAAAGRSLNASEGTLRKRLAELEAEAGVPLTRRAGRRLALTAAGQVLVSGGKAIVADSHLVLERLTSDGSGVVGEYRVAIPVGFPPQVSAQVVAHHLAQFPGIRLRPLPVAAPMALLPDDADFAVTFEPCPADGPWLTAVLQRVPEIVLASRSYLERHGAPRDLDELHDHTAISWRPPGEDPNAWPLRSGGSVPVRTVMTSPDILLVRYCMLAGIGLARVPDGGFPDVGFAPGIAVPVLPEVLGREITIRVVMPDTPRMRGPFRRFLDSIRDQSKAVRHA